jgi:hypothetical protein
MAPHHLPQLTTREDPMTTCQTSLHKWEAIASVGWVVAIVIFLSALTIIIPRTQALKKTEARCASLRRYQQAMTDTMDEMKTRFKDMEQALAVSAQKERDQADTIRELRGENQFIVGEDSDSDSAYSGDKTPFDDSFGKSAIVKQDGEVSEGLRMGLGNKGVEDVSRAN